MSSITDQPPASLTSDSITDEPPSPNNTQEQQEGGQHGTQGLRTAVQGVAAAGAVASISSAAAYPAVALAAAEGLGGAAITTNGLFAIGTQVRFG
jgi:hypothetical protein